MSFTHAASEARRRRLSQNVYDDDPDAAPEWIGQHLLRSGEVAALFQVSRRTISDWARTGKLATIITPGGHRRFPAADVRVLLESQRVGPSRPAVDP